MEVTAVLVGRRVWESEFSLEISDGELLVLGGIAEDIELSVVRQLLEDAAESFPGIRGFVSDARSYFVYINDIRINWVFERNQ